MGFIQWLWLIILLTLISGISVLFTFFPGNVIRFFARLQDSMFKFAGMSDDDIDRLPFYSSFYGENYSKTLKSMQETPEKHKFLIVWARILGCFTLFFTLLTALVFFLAAQSGNL